MTRTPDPKRREQILQAARTVFNERGYAEARMAEIAERAGLAAGTLYLYFESKEALVLALAADFHARLMEALRPALSNPDPAIAIAESVHVALERSAEERDLLRLLCLNISLGSLAEAQSRPTRKQRQQALAQALAARIEQGQFRHYDPSVMAEIIDGLVEWVAEACLIWGDGNLARYEETLIPMLQHALLSTDVPAERLSAIQSTPHADKEK